MATLASPLFDRYFGRAPLPADAVLPAPAAPGEVRFVWYPKPQAAPAAGQAPAAAPSAGALAGGPAAAAPRTRSAMPPPPPPTRPTSQRPLSPEPPPWRRTRPPEPPRRARELDWLTWQVSAALRQSTKASLRETLRWRARECEPLPEPEAPIARARFGLRGEQLVRQGVQAVCDALRAELRETVRTVEARLSWSQRNYRLVMHSARLGQLCRDLERRGGVDVLEVICAGLEPLWN